MKKCRTSKQGHNRRSQISTDYQDGHSGNLSENNSRPRASSVTGDNLRSGMTRSQTQKELNRPIKKLTSLADARKSVDRTASRERPGLGKDISEQVASAVEGWNNIKKKELEIIEECRPNKPAVNPPSARPKPVSGVQAQPKKGQPTNVKETGSKGAMVSPTSKLKTGSTVGNTSLAKKSQSSGTGAQASSNSTVTKQAALAELGGQTQEFSIEKTLQDLENLKAQFEVVAPQSARPARPNQDSPQKPKAMDSFAARRPGLNLQREGGPAAAGRKVPGPNGTGPQKPETAGEQSNQKNRMVMVRNKKYLDEIEGLAQALFGKMAEMQRENGWVIKVDTLKREYAKTLDNLKGEVIRKS